MNRYELIQTWTDKISELLKKEELNFHDQEYYSLMQEIEILAREHFPKTFSSKILEAINYEPTETEIPLRNIHELFGSKSVENKKCQYRLIRLYLTLENFRRLEQKLDVERNTNSKFSAEKIMAEPYRKILGIIRSENKLKHSNAWLSSIIEVVEITVLLLFFIIVLSVVTTVLSWALKGLGLSAYLGIALLTSGFIFLLAIVIRIFGKRKA